MSTNETGRVTLKNLKHSEFASQETPCFEATVYVDGKRVGKAFNDGQGSAHRYDPFSIEKTLNEIAATLPPMDMSDYGMDPVQQDADLMISCLVEDEVMRRRIARMTATKTYVRKPGQQYKKGEWTVIKGKTDEARIKAVKDRYGAEVIILGHNHQDLE
ncbi:MAG: hypothetical protein KGZ70_12895 [Hydrogenophaga sp.]|nr:hypothetical protein [Hydrogenophaga sp.]